jgi:hypothetical protein
LDAIMRAWETGGSRCSDVKPERGHGRR